MLELIMSPEQMCTLGAAQVKEEAIMSGDTLKYQPSTDNSDPIVAAMRSVLKAETVTSKS
jgi:hypothetical protein